jgi:hypothetical protein
MVGGGFADKPVALSSGNLDVILRVSFVSADDGEIPLIPDSKLRAKAIRACIASSVTSPITRLIAAIANLPVVPP